MVVIDPMCSRSSTETNCVSPIDSARAARERRRQAKRILAFDEAMGLASQLLIKSSPFERSSYAHR